MSGITILLKSSKKFKEKIRKQQKKAANSTAQSYICSLFYI